MSCVFCAILNGKQPASLVHADEQVIAFMDIRPARPGQLLVIPRVHVDHFHDLPDDLAAHVLLVGKRIARALMDIYRPARVGMFVHGFGVPHAHLNVMPLHHTWDLTSVHYSYIEDGEVKFAWEKVPLAERAALDAHAEQIRKKMSNR